MRLKLYRAAGMAEAMMRIRAELGIDALILSSRRVGDGVEVTAALETDATPIAPLPPAPALPPDPALEAALEFHGLPAAMRANLQQPSPHQPGGAAIGLEAALQRDFHFAPLPLGQNAPPLLVVGPPGAGKTLTVARLATRLVMQGIAPLPITADGRRAGAAEQLLAFTRLLELDLVVACHPVALARALGRRRPGMPVLIDTPGVDPFDPVQRDELAALATTAGANVVLVLPAGLDAAEAADLGEAFAEIGARHLLITRLDIARRLGGLLAAAEAGGMHLTEAGTGQGVADGLTPLSPAMLAARLRQTRPGDAQPGSLSNPVASPAAERRHA